MKNDYQIIIKKAKIKNLILKVNTKGEIIVKCPFQLNEQIAFDFIKKKSLWIEKQLNKLKEKKDVLFNYDFKNNVYILNKQFKKNRNQFFDYKKKAIEILPLILKETANEIKLKYDIVKIVSSKRIWGSYSNKKVISLNYKLVVLPRNLIKYVIIHELCHSKQMNHSKKFWEIVGNFDVNYKHNRNELKRYSLLLQENIDK